MPDPDKLTVSASQALALFDKHPYFTRFMLWHHFRHGASLEPAIDERIAWGTLLQDDILEATGIVYRLEVVENKANEYRRAGPIGATIDGLMMMPDVGAVVVEAKNLDWLRWRDTWTETQAALHVEVQTQIGMVAAGAQKAIIAALVGGNDLKFYERERDDKLIASIIAEAQAFLDSVRDDRPPHQFGDARELPMLAELYPQVVPRSVLVDYEDTDLALAIRMFESARAEAAGNARLQKQLAAQILGRAGTHEVVKANGWTAEINKVAVSATVCEPHAEPKLIRKATVQNRIKVTQTAEVEIAPKDGPGMMA
jgi:hypothetical protein